MIRTEMIDIWMKECNELNAELADINRQLRGALSIEKYNLIEEGLSILKKLTMLKKKINITKAEESKKKQMN